MRSYASSESMMMVAAAAAETLTTTHSPVVTSTNNNNNHYRPKYEQTTTRAASSHRNHTTSPAKKPQPPPPQTPSKPAVFNFTHQTKNILKFFTNRAATTTTGATATVHSTSSLDDDSSINEINNIVDVATNKKNTHQQPPTATNNKLLSKKFLKMLLNRHNNRQQQQQNNNKPSSTDGEYKIPSFPKTTLASDYARNNNSKNSLKQIQVVMQRNSVNGESQSQASASLGFTLTGYCPCQVGKVEKDSIAESCGLMQGDLIIKVNGKNVSRATCDSIVKLIKTTPKLLKIDLLRPNKYESRTSSSNQQQHQQQPPPALKKFNTYESDVIEKKRAQSLTSSTSSHHHNLNPNYYYHHHYPAINQNNQHLNYFIQQTSNNPLTTTAVVAPSTSSSSAFSTTHQNYQPLTTTTTSNNNNNNNANNLSSIHHLHHHLQHTTTTTITATQAPLPPPPQPPPPLTINSTENNEYNHLMRRRSTMTYTKKPTTTTTNVPVITIDEEEATRYDYSVSLNNTMPSPIPYLPPLAIIQQQQQQLLTQQQQQQQQPSSSDSDYKTQSSSNSSNLSENMTSPGASEAHLNACENLLNLEEKFIELMQRGVQQYSRPLRHCAMVNPSQHQLLFQNIEKILAISEYQLNQLVQQDESILLDMFATIGKLYENKMRMSCEAFDLYLNGVEKSLNLLNRLRNDKQSKLAQFLADSKQDINMELQTFLLLPLHYVTQIYHCLGDIKRHTSPKNLDNSVLGHLQESLEAYVRKSGAILDKSCSYKTPLVASQQHSDDDIVEEMEDEEEVEEEEDEEQQQDEEMNEDEANLRLLYSSSLYYRQSCHKWKKIRCLFFEDRCVMLNAETSVTRFMDELICVGSLRRLSGTFQFKTIYFGQISRVSFSASLQRHRNEFVVAYVKSGSARSQVLKLKAASREESLKWSRLFEKYVTKRRK